jgi:hypothetical protein
MLVVFRAKADPSGIAAPDAANLNFFMKKRYTLGGHGKAAVLGASGL